jgi:hypothetical protein
MKIDTQIESNLMYVNPIQVSTDPTVCVVNRTLKVNDLKTKTQKDLKFTSVGENFISSFKPPSNSEYGQIMNIYVNVRFIIMKMDELKDEKGNLSLIDFLKGILAGINGALGGINELDAFIDEITNTIKIIDKNPIPDIQWLMEHINGLNVDTKLNIKYATFELYGYNTITNADKTITNTAGFIKDFNFKTELSPAMSTMITVGAVANGTVVGENSTALSRLNNGYTDRFKPFIANDTSKLTPLSSLPHPTNNQGFKVGNLWEGVDTGRSIQPPPPPTPNTAKDIFVKIGTEYLTFYNNFIGYLERLSTWKFTFEEISTYKDALVNYNKAYAVYKKAKEDYALALNNQDPIKNETMQPSTGFIPFNLSLTMDGLSGMKINSKFLIDTSYLPSNYPNTVDFLIKGLSHKIEGNKWETMLESYCISKGEYKEAPEKNINPQGQKDQTQSNSTQSNSVQSNSVQQNASQDCPVDVTNRSGKWKNLPLLPSKRTTVPESDVINYLRNASTALSIKRAAYVIFINESAHGKKGINNNYICLQTDGGGFIGSDLNYVSGTTMKRDNKHPDGSGGNCRSFATYDTWQRCIDHLIAVMESRKQSSTSTRKMVPTDPNNAYYFGEGYIKNWVGVKDIPANATRIQKGIAYGNDLYKTAMRLIV